MATAARSTAPLTLQSVTEATKCYKHYWDTGTTLCQQPRSRNANTMFEFVMVPSSLLHYGTDPILGFHLATAFARLAKGSPLSPDGKADDASKAVQAARTLLVAAAPLLSNGPSATIHTELLIRGEGSEKDTFSTLLYGDGMTMSILLGLTPAESCTNASACSFVHEFLLAQVFDYSGRNTQLRSRLAWKLSHHFSGQAPFQLRLHIDPADLVAVLCAAYQKMFSYEYSTYLEMLHD